MTGLHYMALFLLLMGGGFLAGAGYLARRSRPFQHGMECSAVVIDIASRRDEDGRSELYAPVVRFVAHNGQEVTITGAVFSRPCPYKIGQTVTVEYPARAPEQGRIKGEDRLMRTAFGITGGVIAAIGLIVGLIAFSNG
jgi:hypothetical protein